MKRFGKWSALLAFAALSLVLAMMMSVAMLLTPGTTPSAQAAPEPPPPGDVWALYQAAAGTCPGLPATILAAIGKIESGHGTHRRTEGRILGPALDGSGDFALILDTDDGFYDLDPVFDRAVGPMQFIPRTWAKYGVDGSGDGVADPQDYTDAVFSAARYLCANGAWMTDGLDAAILRYNNSDAYLKAVKDQAAKYLAGLGQVSAPTP